MRGLGLDRKSWPRLMLQGKERRDVKSLGK